jgi:hypothetical protein
MKKIVASASVFTLGLLCSQSAQAQQDSKPWNIQGKLRGFYDDNYATLPTRSSTGPTRRASFGFEVSPSLGYTMTLDTTVLSAKYTYGMKYYEDRQINSADHSHQFDGLFQHSFSERYRLTVTDAFVIAQEPSLLDPGVFATLLRSDGDNMVNRAKVDLAATFTDQFGMDFIYQNNYYDYEDEGRFGSRSSVLDRIEHLATIDGRWNALENTTILAGYTFGYTENTSSDLTFAGTLPSTRDSRSHYFFLGVDQKFTPELTMEARAGVQYVDYLNPPPGTKDSTLSPYLDVQASYQYSQEGQVTLGVKHSHNQTDVANAQDAETTTVYGALNHKITPLLTGSLTAQFQNSVFNGGTANNLEENIFTTGVIISYEINKWLTAETGYNYDRLESDLGGRAFYRNRVFIGIRASY